MPSLKSIISAFCFCLLMTFCAVLANADTTYTYKGNQLTNFIQGACPVQSDPRVCPPVNYCPPICSMDASMTFSTPLGDNLNNVSVMPEDFKFYVPGYPEGTQTPANSLSSLPGAFDVSTNASGQIVNWDIYVQDEYGLFTYETFNRSASCPTCAPFADDNFFGYSGEGVSSNMDNPGTWSMSTTGATVPEPASATLLLAGLVGLAGLALKKSL
jgi:hypothetical protein